MGEIKYSKEEYDEKLKYLRHMQVTADTDYTAGNYINADLCNSNTVTEIMEICDDIQNSVREYFSALDLTIQSLQNAGDALYKTDEDNSRAIGD